MEITFGNKSQEHKAKFINQRVDLIESETGERIVIACEKDSIKTFNEFIEYMCVFIGSDIIITEGKDYLISLSTSTLVEIYNMLDYGMFDSACGIKIPHFLLTILTSSKYDELFSNFEWNPRTLTKTILDNSDNASYAILDGDDLDEIDENEHIKHIKLTFKFVTDRYTHQLFIRVSETLDGYDNAVRDAFIIPEELTPNSVEMEMWKKTCQMSLDTYYKCIQKFGGGTFAQNVLPNNMATSFFMTGTLAEIIEVLDKLRAIDAQSNLTQSANMSTFMKEWLFFLNDYDHFTPLKNAVEKLIESFNEERLPF